MPRQAGVSPQPALLGLLLSEPKHGYELYQEFSRELGRVWRIGQSQLYAQLKLLEESRLVSVRVEEQPNRPARKVYQLTPEGRAVFEEWVHQPTPYLRRIRVEFLARLYFFQLLSLDGLDRLVAAQKAVCRDQIERFDRLMADTE
ncbi:MAG: PadR family transcriptional regulator, partial [Anaerolineae bacterium]|nr:PadR family transcriptional regulator [Anaerolineae bacterium]